MLEGVNFESMNLKQIQERFEDLNENNSNS